MRNILMPHQKRTAEPMNAHISNLMTNRLICRERYIFETCSGSKEMTSHEMKSNEMKSNHMKRNEVE
jgi:hypothetical protein